MGVQPSATRPSAEQHIVQLSIHSVKQQVSVSTLTEAIVIAADGLSVTGLTALKKVAGINK